MTVMSVLGKNGKSSHTHTRGYFLYLAKTVITIMAWTCRGKNLPFQTAAPADRKAKHSGIVLGWAKNK
jgi:hypothetical protein